MLLLTINKIFAAIIFADILRIRGPILSYPVDFLALSFDKKLSDERMICQRDFEFNIIRNLSPTKFFNTSKSAFYVSSFNFEVLLIKQHLLKIPAKSASFVIFLSSDFKLNFELLQSLFFKPKVSKLFENPTYPHKFYFDMFLS